MFEKDSFALLLPRRFCYISLATLLTLHPSVAETGSAALLSYKNRPSSRLLYDPLIGYLAFAVEQHSCSRH